jgi:hypothetical protein
MKHHYHSFLTLLAGCSVSVFFSGCIITYQPNSHNLPLFQEKGEVKVNAEIYQSTAVSTILEPAMGVEVQGAYAATKHLGLMANYFSVSSGFETSGTNSLIEVGAGYYDALQLHAVFEIYGGAGLGTLKNFSSAPDLSSHLLYQRFFVQPAIGYTSNVFDFVVSLRFCGLNYSDPETVITKFYEADGYSPDKFSLIAEPALTVRGGWKYVKLQAQVGISQNITDQKPDATTYFSLGAHVTVNKKSYGKKKSETLQNSNQ